MIKNNFRKDYMVSKMHLKVQDLLAVLDRLDLPKNVFTPNQLEEKFQDLQKEHEDQIDINVVGHSQEHNPIHGIFLGEGDKTALWYGFPHANEPFGGTTIFTLATFLLEHRLGNELLKEWQWILVPCIDPDGASLNDPWISHYPDLVSYMKSAHRGLPTDQVEWTFPINHPKKQFNKPLPETKILMELFKQDVRYLHSIHGSAFYGLYAYISDYNPMMGKIFEHVAKIEMPEATIPPPEFDFVKVYSHGLYATYTLEQILEHAKDASNVPSEVGECSWGYFLKHHEGTVLLSEVPMMFDLLMPSHENKSLNITKKRYYKYWQAKFTEINPIVQLWWNDIKEQLPDSRIKRIQDLFISEIDDLARPPKETREPSSDSTLLPFQEFRLSQLYYFRKIMNVYHNFEWLLQQQPDIAVNEHYQKQLDKIIKSLEVEIPMTFLGIQFFDVARIVKAQLTLGLSYQLLANEKTS